MEPFYMTFPMQNLFQTEMEYEKDMERMKEMYPKEVSQIASYVSDRCDELEFEGSRIYDENPDRWMMEREAQALYEKIKNELGVEDESMEQEEISDTVESYSQIENFSLTPPAEWMNLEKADMDRGPRPPHGQGRRMPPPRRGCNDWLCSMVGVLFQDEVYRRRCRYRRCRRWW